MLTFHSGLNITSQLSVFVVFLLMLVTLSVQYVLFGSASLVVPKLGATDIFAGALSIIVVYTMLIRGVGFEVLGGSKSGGMFYVKILLIFSIFFCLINVEVEKRFLLLAVTGFFAATVLPLLSDMFFLVFGETLFNKIVAGSTTIQFYAAGESVLLRIQSAASVAEALMAVLLIWVPLFRKNGSLIVDKKRVIAGIVIIGLIGISGHRIALLSVLLLVMLFYGMSFGWSKLIRPAIYFFAISAVAALAIILVYEHLPGGFQRIFSFLPFIPKNDIVLEAGDSSQFRLLMAAKAFTMLPDYFLIGKGFAFNNYGVNLDDYLGVIDFFAEIGVFHNGPIGLLINLGLPGLFTGLGFIFFLVKAVSSDKYKSFVTPEDRLFLILKCKICQLIIFFLFFYGDVQTNFLELIFIVSFYKLARIHFADVKPMTRAHESII